MRVEFKLFILLSCMVVTNIYAGCASDCSEVEKKCTAACVHVSQVNNNEVNCVNHCYSIVYPCFNKCEVNEENCARTYYKCLDSITDPNKEKNCLTVYNKCYS